MVTDTRKITGNKFTMTLPANWRRTKLTKSDEPGSLRQLRPGDYLDTYYEEGSVLVLCPQEGEISEIEQSLIQLLIKYPMIDKTNELADDLINLAERMKVARV